MADQEIDLQDTQRGYQESPYSDASWEIVGEMQNTENFSPLEVDTVGNSIGSDPFFEDYGGTPTELQPRRWHLPEGGQMEEMSKVAEEEAAAAGERYTDEQIEQIKKQAYDEGKKSMVPEQLALVNQVKEDLEQRVNAVLTDFAGQLDQAATDMEADAVSFALEVAKRILATTVDINPEYILPIIREALSHAGAAVVSKVRVSRQDLEFIDVVGVRNALKEYDASWEFEADDTIRAGCIVESSAGEVVYDLDAAWQRIKDEVVKVI